MKTEPNITGLPIPTTTTITGNDFLNCTTQTSITGHDIQPYLHSSTSAKVELPTYTYKDWTEEMFALPPSSNDLPDKITKNNSDDDTNIVSLVDALMQTQETNKATPNSNINNNDLENPTIYSKIAPNRLGIGAGRKEIKMVAQTAPNPRYISDYTATCATPDQTNKDRPNLSPINTTTPKNKDSTEKTSTQCSLISKPINKNYTCKSCGYNSKSFKKMRRHDSNHFLCPFLICTHGHFKISELITHINLHHKNNLNALLNHCIDRDSTLNRGLLRKTAVNMTILYNKLLPHFCNYSLTSDDKCSKLFTTIGNRKRHLDTHTGKTPYQCSYNLCDFKTGRREQLIRHKLVMHDRPPPSHLCPKCNYKGITLAHLKSHLKSHTTVMPHKCVECPYAGRTRSRLQQHMAIHKNKLYFPCQKCTSILKSAQSLDDHNISFHGNLI